MNYFQVTSGVCENFHLDAKIDQAGNLVKDKSLREHRKLFNYKCHLHNSTLNKQLLH